MTDKLFCSVLEMDWKRVICGQAVSAHILSSADVVPVLSAQTCNAVFWLISPLKSIPKSPLLVNVWSYPSLFSFTAPELEKNQDVDLVRCAASYGVTCLRLIEYFDQKPCLIYNEMIPLLVEKIRINWFPWDSQCKSFEAVQSSEWKMSQKLHLRRPGKV